MSGRTYVVILFFWALLTFITPTLIRLSASAKVNAKIHGEGMERVKILLPRRALVPEIPPPSSVPTPAPTALPEPFSGVDDGILRLRRYFFR